MPQPHLEQEHQDFQITIATDFKERIKEILSEYGIFNINYIHNIKHK